MGEGGKGIHPKKGGRKKGSSRKRRKKGCGNGAKGRESWCRDNDQRMTGIRGKGNKTRSAMQPRKRGAADNVG